MAAEPFMGEIMLFAGNFAPQGWALCDGQLMSIAQNTALFSVLGTTYGGDGVTTFALPDLRGRAPVHAGNGRGLSNRSLGEAGGVENVTLTHAEMPQHTHQAMGRSDPGTRSEAEGGVWANTADGQPSYRGDHPTDNLHRAAIGVAGGGQPHENMSPYLVMSFCIALQGIYPSRG